MAENREEKVQKLVDAIIPEGSGRISPLQTDILRALQTLLLDKPEEKAEVAKLVAKKIHGRYPKASDEYLQKLCQAIEDFAKTEHIPHGPPTGGAGTPPEPAPAPSPSPEPTPEVSPEAPGFSRYLKEILASPEWNNLLTKLAGPNGRLWIDKKSADGKTVRIWLSLDLSPEERAKSEDALKKVIEAKLQNAAENHDRPLSFRFRVDDLSAGQSWKEKWTAKKAGIGTLVDGVAAAPDAGRPAACTALAESLLGTDTTSEQKQTFVALLQQYLARPDGKTDIWTHIRNAYWHADGWRNDADAKSELGGLGIPPDSLKPPSYDSAKIRVWQKIGEEPRAEEIEGKRAPLFYNGTKFAEGIIKKSGTWYSIGTHWVREEHLRISYKYNKDGVLMEPCQFELMAWQAQTEEPKEPPTPTAPPATPPPATPPASPPGPKGPTSTPPTPLDGSKPLPKTPPSAGKGPASLASKAPPASPPLPAGKKGSPDATPPPTTTVSGAAPAPKPPVEPGPAKALGAAQPKVESPLGISAPVTNESLRKQLENAKDVLPPTAENLTEQWLRANRGKKLFLKLEEGADPRPCIVGCLDGNPCHDSTGRVCLCFVHSSGRSIFWHQSFDIAELRRLNLPPAPH